MIFEFTIVDLIIVESPTKARTLSRFLGKGFSVEATMGHIKDLPKEKLSVDVENNFEPKYVPVVKKEKIIGQIKKAAKSASHIYLATDPDREGEAIARHVEDVLRASDKFSISNDQVKRIVFHEITKEAVEEAIKNPGKVNANLVDAQVGRRVLDRLVGYKLSPLLWKKVRRGLSAGRVQTVAVRLIVEREREILAFKPEEYWEIFADVRSAGQPDSQMSGSQDVQLPGKFTVKLLKINGKGAKVSGADHSKKIVSELEKSEYRVLDVKKREVEKSSYPPFTTSTLTQAASRLFGWSAKRTMQLSQRLYEEGLITYHRTDSTNIASVAVSKVRDFISKKYGKSYVPQKPRFFKTKSKLAQEAHEAIRPTDVNLEPATRNTQHATRNPQPGGEEKLYDLIWKRFVACQMANCLFDETVIDVEAHPTANCQQPTANSYLLRASGQIMKFDGWRRLLPLSKSEASELPSVSKDENLALLGVESVQKFTNPPSRFTEASLIKTLESLGIGRPSTYAPTISVVQLRNYVEKIDGKFHPTPIGIAVVDFLVNNFREVFNYSFTAEMESELDEVAGGKREWRVMMKEFYKPFEKKTVDVDQKSKRVKIEVETLGKKCPTCKEGDLVIRIGRFGKFISCSRFPECKHTEKYVEKLDMKCPDCGEGDVIIKTTKRGKKFYGCSRYPNCKWASWKKPENKT